MTTRGGALSRAFAPPPRFAGDLPGGGVAFRAPLAQHVAISRGSVNAERIIKQRCVKKCGIRFTMAIA